MYNTLDNKKEKNVLLLLKGKTIEDVEKLSDGKMVIIFKEFGTPMLTLSAIMRTKEKSSIDIEYTFPSDGSITI